MTKKGCYLFLRVLQFFVLLCIIGLEIAQLILFKDYTDTKIFEEKPISWKEWFGEFYKQHGIKYFYYVVIIITLLYSLINLINFGRRWRTGPHQNVIYIEIFFLLLWLSVGFTNIYPMYFDGSKLNCDLKEEFRDFPGKITECRTYLASMAIGWFMAFLFIITTIYSIYLWTRRDKIRDKGAQNERDKDAPYPHPDNPENP